MCTAKRLHWILALLLVPLCSNAMVYDNRYIPLYPGPRINFGGTRSTFTVSPMAATASKGVDPKQEDTEIGIPEIFGRLDLAELGVATGLVNSATGNPIPADKRGGKIDLRAEGRLQVQGVALALDHAVTHWLSFGGSMVFLRANAWHDFTLRSTEVVLGDGETFETERQTIFDALGLETGHWKTAGFGDIDFYVRLGWGKGYVYKFRYIDAGIRFGVLIPTGQVRTENHPPSIPLGGDGHWGMYVALDALLEAKEDIKVGVLLRINQRFSRKTTRRVPVKEEPSIFGAASVRTNVNPGVTAIFSPYVVLENLREGLGGSVQYTLVSHQSDSWKADRTPCITVPLSECEAEETSKWGADYFTLNIFYDFGKVKPVRGLEPIVSLRWDVPSKMLVVNRVAKTHRLTFGIELAF